MVYDALEMTYRQVKIRKDPNCAVCGENPTVTELIDYEAFCGTISEEAAEAARDSTISVVQLKEMLDAREAGEIDFVLIDVREPNEFEIVSIDGAVLIPKGEILDGSALEQLPNDKQIVLHCKVGRPLRRGAGGRQGRRLLGRHPRRRRHPRLGAPDRAGQAQLLALPLAGDSVAIGVEPPVRVVGDRAEQRSAEALPDRALHGALSPGDAVRVDRAHLPARAEPGVGLR